MQKPKLRSFTKEKKEEKPIPILFLLAVILFTLLSGLFLVWPRAKEIVDLRDELEAKEERLSRLTAKVSALEKLDQAELSKQAEILARALPSEKNIPLLLTILGTVASENDIELVSLETNPGELATTSAEVQKKEKKEKLPLLAFEILTSGDLENLKRFLTRSAQVVPLMKMATVGIYGEDIESKDLESEILLNSPFLLLPTSLGAPEQPLAIITGQEEGIFQRLTKLDFSLTEKELPPVPAGKENPFVF